jgi:hypothetical protein
MAIINAHYFFPNDSESNRRIGQKLRDFIFHILTPNPRYRPNIYEIEEILVNWNEIDKINMNPEAKLLKEEYQRREQGRVSRKRSIINRK